MNANGAPPGRPALNVNWRALVGVALVSAAGLVLAAMHHTAGAPTSASLSRREPRAVAETDPPAEPILPREIDIDTVEAARIAIGAEMGFELQARDARIGAFAFDLGRHNYTVAFYRRPANARRFKRFGDVFHPTGFDAPVLEGLPPALLMRERALGLVFRFNVGDQEVSFDPVPLMRSTAVR